MFHYHGTRYMYTVHMSQKTLWVTHSQYMHTYNDTNTETNHDYAHTYNKMCPTDLQHLLCCKALVNENKKRKWCKFIALDIFDYYAVRVVSAATIISSMLSIEPIQLCVDKSVV